MSQLQKYESTGSVMLTNTIFLFGPFYLFIYFFYQKQLVMISIATVFLWQVQMNYGIFGFHLNNNYIWLTRSMQDEEN